METITINRKALSDLVRIKEEFDSIIESIEIANNPEIMASLRRSKEQIKNREFANWDDLQNSSN